MKKAIKIYLESASDASQIMLSKHYETIDVHKVNSDGHSMMRIASIPVETLRAMCDF